VGELVEKESSPVVPQLCLDATLQLNCPLVELARRLIVAENSRRERNRPRIAVHVAVEGRAESLGALVDVVGLPAVDVALHSIVQPIPAEHALRTIPVLGHPPCVLLFHVRHHRAQKRGVAEHLVHTPHRRRVPVAVAARLGARRLEPVAREIVDDATVVEPAYLGELVAERAADRAVTT